MKPAIYINPEGVVCYIAECPEEPKVREVNQFMYPDERKRVNDKNYEYHKSLAAAKQSAVPFEDQEDIYILYSVTDKENIKPNSIHPFPAGFLALINHKGKAVLFEAPKEKPTK